MCNVTQSRFLFSQYHKFLCLLTCLLSKYVQEWKDYYIGIQYSQVLNSIQYRIFLPQNKYICENIHVSQDLLCCFLSIDMFSGFLLSQCFGIYIQYTMAANKFCGVKKKKKTTKKQETPPSLKKRERFSLPLYQWCQHIYHLENLKVNIVHNNIREIL